MAFKPQTNIKNILITGFPGVGKTTCIKHIVDAICDKNNKYWSSCSISGFYSQEKRKNLSYNYSEKKVRIGFDIINVIDGSYNILARTQDELPKHIYDKYKMGSSTFKHVGKYIVDIAGFEKFVIPLLTQNKKIQKNEKIINIYIIDEIGKMELFSKQFEKSVQRIIDNQLFIVIATVPNKHNLQFVEKLKKRQDSKLFTLTRNNRNLTTTYITKFVFDTIDARLALITDHHSNDNNDSKQDDSQQDESKQNHQNDNDKNVYFHHNKLYRRKT